ncbi:MAG: hypothetical protein AB7I79_19865 [Rhizobiaceae bacterium]
MTTLRSIGFGGIALAAALAAATPDAEAKKARCFTSDDGAYPCEFKTIDGDGSFEITAPGHPGYQLVLEPAGFAFGYANFGDRWVSLPGHFDRATDDRACWDNSETSVRICAW